MAGSSSNAMREITLSELATHNTKKSAWMALNGKVFDVTDFADKHPGGLQSIQQGFGKDATTLFNKVHPKVKYEQILAGKQVGVLKK